MKCIFRGKLEVCNGRHEKRGSLLHSVPSKWASQWLWKFSWSHTIFPLICYSELLSSHKSFCGSHHGIRELRIAQYPKSCFTHRPPNFPSKSISISPNLLGHFINSSFLDVPYFKRYNFWKSCRNLCTIWHPVKAFWMRLSFLTQNRINCDHWEEAQDIFKGS